MYYEQSISAVLIPENEEGCIERCIDSIYNLVDEIIVIDGGSTDRTIDIVSKYDKVRLFHSPFRHGDILGYTKQRNLGISLATKPWIFIIDPDEYLSYTTSDILHAIVGGAMSIEAFQFKRNTTIDGQVSEGDEEWKTRLFRNYCYYEQALHADVVNWKLGIRIYGTTIEHHKTQEQQYFDSGLYCNLYNKMKDGNRVYPQGQWYSFIKSIIKCPVQFNVNMSEYSTLKVGGTLRALALPRNKHEVLQAVSFAKDNGITLLPLGMASNIVIADDYIDALGIKLCGIYNRALLAYTTLEVGTGMRLSELSKLLAIKDIQGFDFGLGIPGTVGGAIKNNSGNKYGCISDNLTFIEEVYGDTTKLTNANDLEINYREIKTYGDLIIKSWFSDCDRTSNLVDRTYKMYRLKSKSQPIEHDTAGSVFKSPNGSNIWKLIDDVGLRGYQIGGARVSDKHTNFIINTGNATAKDVKDLIKLIQSKVKIKHNVDLELELQVIDNHGQIDNTWE